MGIQPKLIAYEASISSEMQLNELPYASSIQRWLQSQPFYHDAASIKIQTLVGDGSSRTFLRLFCDSKTFVILQDPTWKASQDYPDHQTFLKGIGVPVPEFFLIEPKLGFLIMEDLGDCLLQDKILEAPDKKMAKLGECIQLIAGLHAKAYPVPGNIPAASRSFDVEKFSFELQYTLDNLVKGYLGLPLSTPLSSEVIQKYSEELASFTPRVFCHRDYHTRNILEIERRLVLIDFQDARMGPIEYDLASLIFDPYVDLSSDERNTLVENYFKEISGTPLGKDVGYSSSRLAMIGLQRLIKAAGSFAAFYRLQSKKTHLKYLEPCIQTAIELRATLVNKIPNSFDQVFDLETWKKELSKK